LDQAIGRFTDRNRIGRSQSFDARTNIWNLTQSKLLLTPCSSHFSDNHQSSMDAYTDGKLDTFGLVQTLIQVSQGSKNSQTSPYCSLRVIFMRLGIAKVHQESIPKELSYVPIESRDNF
jgi:hypothetical protein